MLPYFELNFDGVWPGHGGYLGLYMQGGKVYMDLGAGRHACGDNELTPEQVRELSHWLDIAEVRIDG
jgi:hypothetical protein